MVLDGRLRGITPESMRPEHQAPAQVDDLDRRLITLLRRDGRASNRKLGKLLGVSEVTVANRIRRLLSDGIIQIHAVPDPARLGYPIEVIFVVHAEVQRLREVAVALRDLPEVRFVSITSGACDLCVSGLFRSYEDLLNFTLNKLPSIPGILRLEAAHALQVLKRNPDWSPFSEPS